jgi:hypothetical protein
MSLYYEYKNSCQVMIFHKHIRDELVYFLIFSSGMILIACVLVNMNLSNLMRVIKAYEDRSGKRFTSYYPLVFAFFVTLLMPVFAALVYIAIVASC